MVIGFILCLIFFLGFRAIGRSTDKRGPADTMGKMMKEDGRYILGVAIIIIVVGAIAML